MKQFTVLAVAVLTMLGSLGTGLADTKLLWRTPTNGLTVVSNSKGTLVQVGQVDVSAYDRLRLIAVTRRPSVIQIPNGFGAPFTIELHIGEGGSDLGLLENGVLALNPTSTNSTVPAHTERTTATWDFPTITALLVDVVGPISGNQQTIVDIYLYGQTSVASSGQ